LKIVHCGEPGYVRFIKTWKWLLMIICSLIAIVVFAYGYAVSKGNRLNLFSLFAALIMLPAVKSVVGIVVTLPYHSVKKKTAEEVLQKTAAGQCRIFTDFLMSSTEQMMYADFVAVAGRNVILFCASRPKDAAKISAYLTAEFKTRKLNFNIRQMDDLEKFTHYCAGAADPGDPHETAAVCSYLKSLIYK